jgi:hypothetical protein
VGFHGRESSVRLVTRGLMFLLAASAVLAAQQPSPPDDLLQELVASIASAAPPGIPVKLQVASTEPSEDASAIEARLSALLGARGLRTTDGASATTVAISCGRNRVERVCVAEIRGDGRDQLATVTRPLTAATRPSGGTSLALELRPLLSQPTQVLDAAPVGDRLLVLDVTSVTLMERKDDMWRAVQSRPLTPAPAWPRDPRGRVRVEGGRLEMFLPGVVCTGRVDPLEAACSDRQQPWPIGVDNDGLEPGRNYFKTREGTTFYNAAPLGAAASDDAIALRAPCAAGTFVVSVWSGGALDALAPSERSESRGGDVLRLSRVADGRLVQAASPLVLPGVLTALWPQPDQTTALVVTRDVAAGRYDAFRTSISCSR